MGCQNQCCKKKSGSGLKIANVPPVNTRGPIMTGLLGSKYEVARYDGFGYTTAVELENGDQIPVVGGTVMITRGRVRIV